MVLINKILKTSERVLYKMKVLSIGGNGSYRLHDSVTIKPVSVSGSSQFHSGYASNTKGPYLPNAFGVSIYNNAY